MRQRYNNNYCGSAAVTIWMSGQELELMLNYGKKLFFSSEDGAVYIGKSKRDSDDMLVATAQDLVLKCFYGNYPEWDEEDELVATVRLPSYEAYL